MWESHGFGRGFSYLLQLSCLQHFSGLGTEGSSDDLVQKCSGGRIGESDQFAYGIFFLRKRHGRLGIEDGEDIAAMDSAHHQAIALDANHAVFLVEN